MPVFQIVEFLLGVAFFDFVNVVVVHGHQPSSLHTQLALAGAQNIIPRLDRLYSLASFWITSLQSGAAASEPSLNPIASEAPSVSSIPDPYDDPEPTDSTLYIAIAITVLLSVVFGVHLVRRRCQGDSGPQQPVAASNSSLSSSSPPPLSPSAPPAADSHSSVMAELFAGRLRHPEWSRAESSDAALERQTRLTHALDGFRAIHRGWPALSRFARSTIVRRLFGDAGVFVATGFVNGRARLVHPMAVPCNRVDVAAATRALAGFDKLLAAYSEFTDAERGAILRHLLDGAPSVTAAGVDADALSVEQPWAPTEQRNLGNTRDEQRREGQRMPLRDIGGQQMRMAQPMESTKHARRDDENAPLQPSGSRIDKGKRRVP